MAQRLWKLAFNTIGEDEKKRNKRSERSFGISVLSIWSGESGRRRRDGQ